MSRWGAMERKFIMAWREKRRVFNIDGTVFEVEQYPLEKSEDEAGGNYVPKLSERKGVWKYVVLSFAVREWIARSFQQLGFMRILELGVS